MTDDAGFAIAPQLDGRPDPLDLGFVLVGGVLAPLPRRVRLPHEDDEGEEVLV